MSSIFTEEMLIQRMGSYRNIAIILSIIFMAIGLYAGINSYIRSTDILSDHTVTAAKVTDAEHRLEEGKKGRMKDVYEIFYAFKIDDDEKMGQFTTSEEKFELYKSKGELKIAYSNKSPTNYDRLGLLERQSKISSLLVRLVKLILILAAFFSILGMIIKVVLKKKVGSEMEST